MATRHARRNETIINLLKTGKTQEEVAKMVGLSRSRISQIVALQNKPLTKTDIARNNLNDIIAHYNQGVTITNLAKMYGVSYRFLRTLLMEVNVYQGRKRTKFSSTLNHDFLNELTPDSEYVLGVLSRLGSTDQKNRSITLTAPLNSVGAEAIARVTKLVSPKNSASIKTVETDTTITVQIPSSQLLTKARNLGAVVDNTLGSSSIPEVELLRSADFWRGVLDAGGNVGLSKLGAPYAIFTFTRDVWRDGFTMFMNGAVKPSLSTTGVSDALVVGPEPLYYLITNLYEHSTPQTRTTKNYERAALLKESLSALLQK